VDDAKVVCARKPSGVNTTNRLLVAVAGPTYVATSWAATPGNTPSAAPEKRLRESRAIQRVVNLMDALRQSISGEASSKSKTAEGGRGAKGNASADRRKAQS